MAQGRTLWQILVGLFQDPTELRYYNPLKARVGQAAQIDDLDWRELQFFIQEIREYKRQISGKQFRFVDYVLMARQLNADDVWLRIRLSPTPDPDREGIAHHVLMLHLEEDMGYDQGLHQALNAGTGVLEITDADGTVETFARLHGLKTPYKVVVTILQDEDDNRRIDDDEIERRRVEYWDYVREVPDAAGHPTREYLFVEMDTRDGWIQTWRGQELDPRRVALL